MTERPAGRACQQFFRFLTALHFRDSPQDLLLRPGRRNPGDSVSLGGIPFRFPLPCGLQSY